MSNTKELTLTETGVEKVAPPPEPPRRSYQIDDDEPNGYTATIKIDGHKIFIRELSRDEFNEVSRVNQEIADAVAEVQQASLAGQIEPAQLAVQSTEVSDRQAAQYAALVNKYVVAWELPGRDGYLPCTPETKAKLPVSVQCELAMKILQKSRLGQDESGF